MKRTHNTLSREEATEYTAPESAANLTDNQIFQKQCLKLPWFQELNDLGKHWHPRESENDPRWKAQVEQAYSLAYIALRANGTKYFDHRTDADDIVTKAWEFLQRDIDSFDPQKSQLGVRVSAQIEPRIIDAIDHFTRTRNHQDWADELTLLQDLYSGDSVSRQEWIDAVIRKAFHFYRRRIDSVASTPEIRTAIRESLRAALTQFDPAVQSLHKLIGQWVSQVLRGDQRDVDTISLDTPTGEEENTTIGSLIPDTGSDPAEIVENTAELSIVLLALTVNYQIHAGQGNLRARTLYSRLNYTEQLSCFAQSLALPDSHRQDILKPLEEDYFRYFMQVGSDIPLTLRTIEKARIRTVIGTGPYRLENKSWNDQGFLPAKAQMGYLAGKGISTSNSTISEQRKPYCKNFLNCLEGLR